MTVRCKECRWWGDENETDDDEFCMDGTPAPELRRCKCPEITFMYDQYEWHEESCSASHSYPHEGGAMTVDGEGYFAAFKTTATFGCTLGERRAD
jgi:hypothetical protein